MDRQLAKIFKSLSDETRVQIIIELAKSKTERSCQDLSQHFKLSQPTLSHHFTKLVDAGVIHERKEGISRYYRINKELLSDLGINIEKLISAKS